MQNSATDRAISLLAIALEQQSVATIDHPQLVRTLPEAIASTRHNLEQSSVRVNIVLPAESFLECSSFIENTLATKAIGLTLSIKGIFNFSPEELTRQKASITSIQIFKILEQIRQWKSQYQGLSSVDILADFSLFTPWTTLQDLRINLNIIRRFSSYLGSGALFGTKLTISYGHPIFSSAKTEGLIVTTETELPETKTLDWRFKDSRVAKIFEQCQEHLNNPITEQIVQFQELLDQQAGIARGKRTRHLRLVSAPNEKQTSSLKTQQISLNKTCNQRCGFCTWRGREESSDRQRAINAILSVRSAAKTNIRRLVISGAEPTLEWYLSDLIRLAKDLGISEVQLETNATLLDQNQVQELVKAGLTHATVAINAIDAVLSDSITGDTGGFAKTVDGVNELLKAGVSVSAAVALTPSNVGQLEAIVRHIDDLFVTPSNRVQEVIARYIVTPNGTPFHIKNVTKELERTGPVADELGIKVASAPGGELPPCVFDSPYAARSFFRLAEAIVKHDHDSYARINQCNDCVAKRVCAGPLKAIAAQISTLAQPIRVGDQRAEVVPLPKEQQQIQKEYTNQFFMPDKDGKAIENRVFRINFHCNQACDFCFVSRQLPPVDESIVEADIRQASERGAVINISGGEPTLNPKLATYISLALRSGASEVELQTNAVKLADFNYARSIVGDSDRERFHAFVSLHGTTAEVSDRVTAAPGTFVKTIEGIQNLLKLGVSVRLNYVLCGYNMEQFALFPDYVRNEFIAHSEDRRIQINFSYVQAMTDNVPRDIGLIPQFSKMAPILEQAYNRAKELGIAILGFESKCGVPPCFLPAEIRTQHFAVDLPQEEREKNMVGFLKSEKCHSCALNLRCYGVRETYAELYGTTEVTPIEKL